MAMNERDLVEVPVAPRLRSTGPLDDRPAGRSILPARAYTDAAWFAAEQHAVFAAGWVWAGFEHWVPATGDVHPVSVGGQPLLIVRGTDGDVAVLHNVCRHRGLLLCEEAGHRSRLRCPYHGWTYSLDGALQATPYWERSREGGPDDETRAELHLVPVPSATWAGMVFVDLGDTGVPFETAIAPLSVRWAPFDLGRLTHADTRRYDIDANWKLVVENFLDFYHLPFIHPQVGPASIALDVDDLVLDERIIGGTYPRGAAGKAAKTVRPLPTFGEVPQAVRDRQDIFCVFPNALLFIEADWFQVIAFEPVDAHHTVEHMAVFVDRDAMGDDMRPARRALADVLFGVNDQDVSVLRRLQAGRASTVADRNHLVTHWDQITARFQLLVAAATATAAAPATATRG
jgi:choline monooxygenase